ncbi:SDR family oxidoreductase [Flavobacterium frigoris]|uniref:Nucleoside-diphosphate-sugar epimerase n=1 Tax=Flavobacterium frigoris (strain PS1) TaxID=1086011 RepID=H7FN79_FLAFP|nr:SDR family oxidoreductase [Flavobacterium frigoris]EIA09871.1 nucleoside-diphosphate-sugar epimerase [Flavobacterium frigoris PS1]
MKQISILGCGWMGLPLAKALIEKNTRVKGSTTSVDKLSVLEKTGIQAFLLELDSKSVPDALPAFFEGSETLIIAIPPKLRGKNKDYSDANSNSFVKKIANLLPLLERSSIQNLLFISSTAVYGDANAIVDEHTKPIPVTESGKQLLAIEKLLLENIRFKTTILRFGGLIGKDRHPARFLAGKENADNPEAPINLIHQDDCIEIIMKILETNTWGEILNAVTPYHPSREQYYTQKAVELNLVPPTFNHSHLSTGKTILSDKLKKVLDYTFIKTHL